ncbi:MAG: gamma carbonic anhydrase family protein [Bdellovibrionota bacterium]
MNSLLSVRGFTPKLGKDCFIAPNAMVIGDVIMGDRCSIWFNVTLRGDVMPLRVGHEVNIQDGSVLHGTQNKVGVTIGDRTTIGHNVTLHGCSIGRECLIGMGSLLMDEASIGDKSVVGAGSLVTESSKFPGGVLILGRPAKVIRELKPEEIAFLSQSADNYLKYKTWYTEARA